MSVPPLLSEEPLARYALLTALQSLLTLGFYIGALVFVVLRRTRLSPRSARLAVWSLVLILGGIVVNFVSPLLLGVYSSRTSVGSDYDYLTFAILMGAVTGGTHIAAILLLLMALFGDRPQPAWPGPWWPAPSADPTAIPSGSADAGPVVLAPGPAGTGPHAAPGAASGPIPPWATPGSDGA